jgi:protein-S-isoprenylcysteine O-methyltransferase Ste14
MILLGFFLIGWPWTPGLPLTTPLLSGKAVQWMGAAAAVLGCAFAIWARLALGSNWSGRPTVKVGHELVVRGPYAFTRHPIYTGILLAAVGLALDDLGWLRVVGLAAILVALLWKMRLEEQLLIRTFPESYPSYQQRTRKLIPWLF